MNQHNVAAAQPPAAPQRRMPMGLITLNVALGLAAMVLWMIPTPGNAQPRSTGAAPPRAIGQYTMVSGKLNTGNAQGVYIVDSANQELIGVKWDTSRKGLVPLGYRNLINDRKAPSGR